MPASGAADRPGPCRPPATPIVLACPTCGSRDLASVERLTGTCPGRFEVAADGRVTFIGRGHTTVEWDSSTTDGAECLTCGWRYRGQDWADQLVPAAIPTSTPRRHP